MSSLRLTTRLLRISRSPSIVACRTRSISQSTRFSAKTHPNASEHQKIQTEKPLGPHLTNTNSTIANEAPSVGAKQAPPELISSVDGNFVPKDSVPENTKRMTGGTQSGDGEGINKDMRTTESGESTEKPEAGEMGVGEMEEISFKIEPLRRTGEDANTMRARLVYQSRKRGTLESDLLMSTFADTHLEHMTIAQMTQYDLFLDENDWDIYYWATQEPTPTSQEYAEGAGLAPAGANATSMGKNVGTTDPGKQTGPPELETDEWRKGKARSGEWAQTIGTFKPAYRPVPVRWRNSEILAMLRKHVRAKSAGGVLDGKNVVLQGSKESGGGMAFMPEVRNMDS